MLVLLAAHLVAALLAPALVRWLGLRAFYVLAVVPAAGLGWALAHTAAMRDGGAVAETYPWVGQLGLELAFRMTTLSWLMVLLVGGVGALVLVYSARYFPPDQPGLAGSPASSSPSPAPCSAWSSPTTCCCCTCSGS